MPLPPTPSPFPTPFDIAQLPPVPWTPPTWLWLTLASLVCATGVCIFLHRKSSNRATSDISKAFRLAIEELNRLEKVQPKSRAILSQCAKILRRVVTLHAQQSTEFTGLEMTSCELQELAAHSKADLAKLIDQLISIEEYIYMPELDLQFVDQALSNSKVLLAQVQIDDPSSGWFKRTR